MPRRRDPIKTRELSVLLRDAQPVLPRDALPDLSRNTQPPWQAMGGEPSVRKLRERERARVSALEELARMYREAEKRGSLDQLDIRVRNLIERVKVSNLPEPKGGRPFGHRDSKRLSLAIKTRAAVAARGKKKVINVLYDTAEQLGVSYDYLHEIHYDIDPEWRQDVKTEVARKDWEAIVPYSPALWFWAVEFDPMRDL
jgi:hypothetical protein